MLTLTALRLWFAGVKLWAKKYFGWLWSPITLVGIVLGALAIKRAQTNRVNNLKDALTVERARRDVEERNQRMKLLGQQIISNQLEIEQHSDAVTESKRRVVQIEGSPITEDMTDAEIADRFSKIKLRP
jgi:hypothetical protein